uniref:Uncharacterized protein n=1 Tax=Moniliophthora roreri TaxID=221103 RepID=A0A0W0F4U2_MONRR
MDSQFVIFDEKVQQSGKWGGGFQTPETRKVVESGEQDGDFLMAQEWRAQKNSS